MGIHTATGAESLAGVDGALAGHTFGSSGDLSASLHVFDGFAGTDMTVHLDHSPYSVDTLVADDDALVLVQNLLTNHTFTLGGIGYSSVDPRYITITIVDSTPSIVAGTVRVTGTNALGGALTEDVSIAAGAGAYRTKHRFKTVTEIKTLNDVTVLGGSGNETIKAGVAAVTDLAVDDDALVLVTNLVNNHTFTIGGAGYGPDARYITITVVDTTPSITAGTVRITGTDKFGNALIENISIAAGAGTYTTAARFLTVTEVKTLNDVVTLGGAGNETIKVGVAAIKNTYEAITGGAFTAVTSSHGRQSITASGPIRRWLRVRVTTSGGFTLAKYVVAVKRYGPALAEA